MAIGIIRESNVPRVKSGVDLKEEEEQDSW